MAITSAEGISLLKGLETFNTVQLLSASAPTSGADIASLYTTTTSKYTQESQAGEQVTHKGLWLQDGFGQENEVITETTGRFTFTPVGFTSATFQGIGGFEPSYYTIHGNIITILVKDFSGQSNTNYIQLTNLPSFLKPKFKVHHIVKATNDGSKSVESVSIGSNGTWTFQWNGGNNNFTTSGYKGMENDQSFTYQRYIFDTPTPT